MEENKNLFMMCEALNFDALSEMPPSFHVRICRKDETELWMAMHFDDPAEAEKYRGFMVDFFQNVYAEHGDLFYQKCLMVCDSEDKPVGTCFDWKAYDAVNTIHWFKVLKPYEGKGIGRALFSLVMKGIAEYPVFLHTQPSSYRAIKLYTDFGFSFLTDPFIGSRRNDLEECLPILQNCMPQEYFQKIRTKKAPAYFLDAVASSKIDQF